MANNMMFQPYEIDPATLQKMHDKMLGMLLYFEEFCAEHGLMFYLCGGGAIGAIREKGFVPWDDDIDCFMPRPDYEKLPELWEKYGDKERFAFCRTDETVNYHHPDSTLRDRNTTFICTYTQHQDICHGLCFDIIPIDGCPTSKFKRYVQLFYAFVFALFNTQRLPNNKGKLFRTGAKIAYALIPSKKLRYKLWKHAEKQMTKYHWEDCDYVTELIGSIKGMLLVHPKEWFDSQVWVDFEGHKAPLMAGYHQYLTLIFGNYMQRPPVEQQVAKHELAFVDMDRPYTDYKGVKYFPQEDHK